jgi:very-short-patch-repair endonuclease
MPSDDESPWKWLLFRQSGIISHRQVLQHHTEAYLKHRLAKGLWRRVFRGVYTTHALTVDAWLWAAVLAAGDGAVLAGLAAARAEGLKLRSQRQIIDVLSPHCQRSVLKPLVMEMPVVRVHRRAAVNSCGAPPRTKMAVSVVDAAQWALTDNEARLIVATACQQRKVLPSEVLAALGARAKRRSLIAETATYAEGGATSLAEIDFKRLCRKHRLPPPTMQERRMDSSGRMRYLDAYWKEQKLHIEIDGAHHMEATHWTADMLRQNEVWLDGDRVLRFPAHLLRTKPDVVIAQLRKALTGS